MSGDVTTVVVTHNRAAELTWSLPHHEPPVVLVDNGSTDGTVSQVRREHPDIEVIALHRNHGAVGRNFGVRAARTQYVAFADDDSWWAPGALDIAAGYLDSYERLGLLAATVLVGEEQRPDGVTEAMAHSPLPPAEDLPGRPILGFVACGAVVRRSAFLEVGGFDEVIGFRGEEERLALDLASAGWGLAFVPEVVAHHHPSSLRPPGTRAAVRTARNRLLTAVMRRPWPVVVATGQELLSDGVTGARGLLAALPRFPRAWAMRQPVPPEVEAHRRLLD